MAWNASAAMPSQLSYGSYVPLPGIIRTPKHRIALLSTLGCAEDWTGLGVYEAQGLGSNLFPDKVRLQPRVLSTWSSQ